MHDFLSSKKSNTQSVNNNIEIIDRVNCKIGLRFDLTDPVAISNILEKDSKFKLILGKNHETLIAFAIEINDFTTKQITNAFQQANRFTNFLSFQTKMYVFHKRPYKIKDGKRIKEISPPLPVPKKINLNMNDETLIKLLENDSIDNQQLAHLAGGLRALEDKVFSTAITELYQVIENKDEECYKKYKCIRHGLSHLTLDDKKTIECLKKLCIPLLDVHPDKKSVDRTSPECQAKLEEHAKTLLKKVIESIKI